MSNVRTIRLLLLLFCGLAIAQAQNSGVHVSQLSHEAWRLQEGALPAVPNVIAQTKDGYIWLGTESGLYRFDGRQFEEVALPSDSPIRSSPPLKVVSLVADRDGTLWVGANGKLLHLSGGALQEVAQGVKFLHLIQTSSNEIWSAVSLNKSPACRVLNGKLDCWQGSRMPYSEVIAEDASGGLWVSDRNELEHRVQGKIVPQSDAEKLLTIHINILSRDGRGDLWAAHHTPGEAPDLLHYDGHSWRRALALPGVDNSTEIESIVVDRETAIWVGTSNRGLYRIFGSQVDHFGHSDGLTADDVDDIFQDAEGSIWIATSSGLDQFHRSLVDTWTIREGLTTNRVYAILADHSGRIWMSNKGGLDILENGVVHSYHSDSGLPGQSTRGLAEDHLGRIWVGIDKDLYIFEGHAFRKVLGPGGIPLGLVLQMKEDARGRMWVQSLRGLFRQTPCGLEALPVGLGKYVAALEPDAHGGMWIGAYGIPFFHVPDEAVQPSSARKGSFADVYRIFDVEGEALGQTVLGLSVVRQGQTHNLDQQNGLFYKRLLGSEMGRDGDLFLMTDSGYLQVLQQDLLRWLRDPKAALNPRSIDRGDGALPGISTFAPRSSVAPNGDVWFATDRFAQRIDPKQVALKRSAPPLVVEAFRADGKKLNQLTQERLPAGTQDISIRYAALSYLNPLKITYMYMLKGFDQTWQSAGTRPEAIYTHVPPGTYTFLVTASEGSDSWTTTSTPFVFSVAPRFYQTLWFRCVLAISIICLLWLAYLTRLRYLARQANARFLERLKERERIARDLHDTFFQAIQGILLRVQAGASAMRSDDPVRQLFDDVLRQSDQVMLEGRELVLDLRESASENEDLKGAFDSVCQELEQLFPTPYQIIVQGRARPLEPRVRQELFLIGREALMNAFQHSEAKSIEIEISFGKRSFGLRVRDDGKGLDSVTKAAGQRLGHFGLTGMRERAVMIGATLELWSQTGAGTEIDVEVPSAAAFNFRNRRWEWPLKTKDTPGRSSR